MSYQRVVPRTFGRSLSQPYRRKSGDQLDDGQKSDRNPDCDPNFLSQFRLSGSTAARDMCHLNLSARSCQASSLPHLLRRV